MAELTPKKLRKTCDPSLFKFDTTEELAGPKVPIGQDRAVHAVEFAADIASEGYNAYVMGQVGTGRSSVSRELLEKRGEKEATPDDWCYVYNFKDPRKPKAISVSPGRGTEWQDDMDDAVQEIMQQINEAFESEEYIERRDDILRGFREERNAELQEFEEEAEAEGFTLGRSPAGLIVAPASDGEVMNPQEYRELEDEEREKLEDKRQELQQKLGEIMRKGQREERQTREEVMDLDRGVVREAIEPILEELKDKYSDNDDIVEHLDAMEEDLLDSVPEIRQTMEEGEEEARMRMGARLSGTGVLPVTDRYRVNLLVDNSETDGAPVISELNPTIENLTGEVEHQSQMGALVTDFTMIKPGALHRANGGYLLLEAHTVLLRPYAWDALKRALKNNRVRIESVRDQFRIISTVSLEPTPIPLDVKIVLIGNPLLYHLLYQYDEDFRKLFKVKADFDTEIDRRADSSRKYAQFISDLCEEEDLMPFVPEAVAKVVEHGSRLASDQDKLSVKFSKVGDVVREASYYASQNGHDHVTAEDVLTALEKQIYRSNRLEQKIIEMIADGTIMVDVDGEKAGQINGLAVVPLGDYHFGKPGRITCQTYLGNQGAVSIDREADLTGNIHDKGVLTLTGYLGERYAQHHPISLAASLSFEQMYDGVEGDSASSTELYAILSSVAGVPIKQGIAVTGSVNQKGEVQAIGGVNEKIEGFYMTCKAIGLTGEQGVMIPQANVKHLMLREEVVEAVENGDFHIWAVETIDEGIELLTGIKAGERDEEGKYPEDSINGMVEARLTEMAEKLKEYGGPSRRKDDDDQ